MGKTSGQDWAVEVVRGKDVGKRYALAGPSILLGNASTGAAGINLADQEGTAPRRMAANQAEIAARNGSLTIRDLDSPGGTFVNRQRVLPGQSRPLQDGDVLQLGGVQLRLVRSTTAPAPSPSAKTQPSSATPPASAAKIVGGGFPFVLKTGATCRSWDDFLAVSAQRWTELRDELTSGRLAGFALSVGREDLSPNPNQAGSPDERLDAWIGRLPTTRPAKPELEVHPRSLVIRALSGGGTMRKKLQITNSGYGLLKTTSRVEPPSAAWLTIAAEGRSLVTIESSDLPIEAAVPEDFAKPLSATIVIEGNGGTVTVAVRLEPATKADAPPDAPSSAASPRIGLLDRISRQSAASRLTWWPILAVLVRLGIGLAAMIPAMAGWSSSAGSPDLLGPAIAFAAIGALLGIGLALRLGEARDVPSSGFAGSIAGVMVASLVVAAARTVEPILGARFSGNLLLAAVLWGLIGATLAGISLAIAPDRPKRGVKP